MTESTPGPLMSLDDMLQALIEYARTWERYELLAKQSSWVPLTATEHSNIAHDAEVHTNRLKQAIIDQYGRVGE